MAVDSVALKLPTFWVSSPLAWFAQAEAQFALRNISQDDTKYYHVVSSLDTNTATRALSIITSPPPSDKYSTIKSFLTSAYGLTDGERALALLNIRGLGDSKPSELMDNMLSLLGQHRPCFLFRQIFLQQLPEHVRTPLAVSDTSDYHALLCQHRAPFPGRYRSSSFCHPPNGVRQAKWTVWPAFAGGEWYIHSNLRLKRCLIVFQ